VNPTLDEWRRLYEAAVEFRDLAPWDWTAEEELFGVQDPETGEIGYCCVLGGMGEHFALALYLGSEGLDGLWRMRTAPPAELEDPLKVLAMQKCLMASFEDRGLLEKRDLDAIKALGLKFRGRGVWPHFRSYLPGYAPWFLTAPEARFLTLALRQAADVTTRLRENPDLVYMPTQRGKYLVRVPKKVGKGLRWEDAFLAPEPFEPAAPPAPSFDARKARALAELPGTDGVLEMDFFTMPEAVVGESGERPYLPTLVLAVDRGSGMVLGFDFAGPGEAGQALVDRLLAVIEQVRMRPQEVSVRQQEAYDALEPLARALGVSLARTRRLRVLDSAVDSLFGFLGGGRAAA
jgi:hypothetical protein